MNLQTALTLLPAALLGQAAALDISPAFSPGMVIQRDAVITVTGYASSGDTVNVSLGAKTQSTSVADDGSWTVRFAPMNAGGPFLLEASDSKSKASVDDILVGDVWVCVGQSNMQMGLAETIGGAETVEALTKQATIRLLTIPSGAADTPQAEPGAKWQHASPESLGKFSAVAACFAQCLHDDHSPAIVPLGIINSSFGGTAIEAWSPADSLADIPEDQTSGSMFGIKPGTLFNRMIHPLFAYRIKGVVWYQGEANAGHPEIYAKLLQNMITQWRTGWNQPDLPFLIVQLPAFEGRMSGLDFSWLREAEAKACDETPHTWLAVSHDTTAGLDLHPREKHEIGRRLSLLARHEVYGENIVAHGPAMTDVKTEDDKVIITFDQPVKAARGETIHGFQLAGENGDYRFAHAVSDGNQVILTAGGVSHPKTVRYAWGGLTDANLTNATGLPATPFRTDTLAPESLAFQPLPTTYHIETPVYQLETGRLGRVASLIVHGKQFLSHEPGGGTGIPTFLGPRNLSIIRSKGPRRIAFTDNTAEVEIACADESIEWTVRNHDSSPIEFHIALSPQATVEVTGTSVLVSRNGVILKIDGIDHADPNGTLVAKIPPHKSGIIHLSIKRL